MAQYIFQCLTDLLKVRPLTLTSHRKMLNDSLFRQGTIVQMQKKEI